MVGMEGTISHPYDVLLDGPHLVAHLRAQVVAGGHGLLASEVGGSGDLVRSQHYQLHHPTSDDPPLVSGGMEIPTEPAVQVGHDHFHGPPSPVTEVGVTLDAEEAVDRLRVVLRLAGVHLETDPESHSPPPDHRCPHCGGRLWLVVNRHQVEELQQLRRAVGDALDLYGRKASGLLLTAWPVDPANPVDPA